MNDFINHPHRVLGLLWHPQNDYLSLRLNGLLDFLQKRKNTKRFLLMAADRIFDPLGFVSPFTIRFKILFQEIWQQKTDWDEELLPEIREKFELWCSEASSLSELQIPRYALECDSANCPEYEIHTFSDASIKAYGAVSYVRLKTSNKVTVHLLASKSHVAPLKSLTHPRLELMGALLAARLAKEVSRVLSGKISTTNYFWTDSTIALSWIQGPSCRWKVFVANRIKEIRSLTDKDSWHHCPGKDNPSDLLTRGISADSLINCDKWWNGPSFLHEKNTVPVSYNVLLSDESAYLEELRPSERKTLTVTLDNTFLNNILSVYNNFQKILCVFSYIYRFINNCKKPFNKQIGPTRICEIQQAEITLVKLVQQLEFNSEIKDLSIKSMVNPQIPMECIRLFKEIPFMPLFEFVRKRFFFAALVVFWSVFCGLFFKNEPEWNHISSYIPSFSPLFFLLAVFLLDLFEKGVQVKNPFFSTWNLAVGIRHWPVFNIISGVLATVYGFFLVGRLCIIFKNSVLARKFYMNTRGARLYKGSVHAFRFVMYLVCTSIFMTLLAYHINQVNEIYIKGNGWNPFEFFSYQTAVYCGVYVLWNYTIFCLLILYAPARRYNPHPEGEEEGN
ncbi:protein wntless homolog A [Trichonephila clavata]|uniref:Protein wntless homolog A n=1 Tax=Trichonephila clavata TaxID=2740835 RepID=A0A8X6JBY7_TRICU|nr:protein wntless homolog A [Trichonephila clavata]